MSFQRIAVVGGGAWGTALANAAALAGREVVLWMRDRRPRRGACARRARTPAPSRACACMTRVRPTADLADLADADAALLVVPAQTVRAVTQAVAAALPAARRSSSAPRASSAAPGFS